MLKEIGNFCWWSMECGGFDIMKARQVTVKQLLLYSINCCNWGPTAKSVSVIYYELTNECKIKTMKTHCHIYIETFEQQWKWVLWLVL